MYAIIRAGGHQEKVSVGETITVDHLKQDPDSEIRFTPLMISVGDNAVTDRKELADKGAVVGRVVQRNDVGEGGEHEHSPYDAVDRYRDAQFLTARPEPPGELEQDAHSRRVDVGRAREVEHETRRFVGHALDDATQHGIDVRRVYLAV